MWTWNGWQSIDNEDSCSTLVPWFPHLVGELNRPLPPGLLPSSLRVLLLNQPYNQSLQPGSLPSTLTFRKLGDDFDQPLSPGVLPASLVYLSVICFGRAQPCAG